MPHFDVKTHPHIALLDTPQWRDYELLDTGDGLKLERFGAYRFVRPEVQCMWRPSLPASAWQNVHAVFQPSNEESGGHWNFKKKVPEKWEMRFPLTSLGDENDIRFTVMTTPGRHLGVFPECGAHWDWTAGLIAAAKHPVKVLNLFGYTGLASLAAAAAGAAVTHVDASKKSVTWARENQSLSKLEDKPIRWIVDDALKFVQREARRGNLYDGILLDPPKFGRGPKGEIWEIYKSLPALLDACRTVLTKNPLFVVVTMYAVQASPVHLQQTLEEMMRGCKGQVDAGELVTHDTSAGRTLSHAVYARWSV